MKTSNNPLGSRCTELFSLLASLIVIVLLAMLGGCASPVKPTDMIAKGFELKTAAE